jgi:predicted lipoprotein
MDFRKLMMAKWISATLGLVMAGGVIMPAAAAPSETDYQKVAQKAYHNYILPSFEGLQGQAGRMEVRIKDFCASPSKETHDAVRAGFGRLVYQWGAVEFLRFGPMEAENRFHRLLFWPDRKGTALKKVRRAINGQDAKRLESGALAKGSVAFQGLNALEYALFGEGYESLWAKDDANGKYRCELAHAIASNIVATSSGLVKAWSMDGFGKTFTQPGKDNPVYREGKEVVAELVKALGTNGQYFTDVKLLPVVGKELKKAKPKKAMFRRADASLISMQSSLDHAGQLIHEADFEMLLDEDAWWIINGAEFELKNGSKTLKKLREIGMPKAVTDEEGRKQFQYLETVVRGFGEMMIAEYAAGAALVIGFNSLDGD